MKCEECRDLLGLYVTGGLDAVESAGVRGHLAEGCPECAGELSALEAAFHSVPLGLKGKVMPERAWGKIEERIAFKAKLEGGAVNVAEGKGARVVWVRWAVAAAMVVMLGTLVMNTLAMRRMSDANAARESAMMDQLEKLRGANDLNKREMMDHMTEMATATAYEMGAGTQAPAAKLFWNKVDGMWMLVASGLKPLPAGMTYELWIINDKGEKIAAGTFAPDGEGRAMHEVKLPADAGTITTAAVTDEPMGGKDKPTGSIQFMGKL